MEVLPMPLIFRCSKGDIPLLLVTLHDFMIRELLGFFEKGRIVRKKTKEARKAINKALKIAKKKRRNPGVMIGTAIKTIKGLNDDIEYTRKILQATFHSMEKALDQIQKERIEDPTELIENAQVYFEKKNFEKGLELLKASKDKINTKVLLKTRTAIFGGISEIKDFKQEIENQQGSPLFKKIKQRASRNVKALSGQVKSPRAPHDVFDDIDTQTFATGVATIEADSLR
jgi:hypothetical protein